MDRPFVFRPRVERLARVPSAAALEALARVLRAPAWLDSAAGTPADWSLFAFDPLPPAPPRTLDGLRAYVARLARDAGDDVPGPFGGGFVGALAYDLGVAGEDQVLPEDPFGLPPIAGGLYVDFLVIEHAPQRAWLVLGAEPGDGRAPLDERRAAFRAALAAADDGPLPDTAPFRPLGPLVRHVPGAVHRARVEEVRRRIARGDLYQANLAHRFTRAVAGHPAALYARLRRANPAPYMSYLAWGPAGRPGGAVLSASPELLLDFDGERALTRPIKGTAPRAADPVRDPVRDAALAAALLASEKDRAELAMIVDLERNDLGRVAVPGSVRARGFPTLASYATVHHLVADVEARVAPGLDGLDVLRALFPGGSITGAPKLAAMDVIAELEGEGRGFFTGALGFLGLDGRACFDILIRTLAWRPLDRPRGVEADAGEVVFHVGGGITWSSDAHAEEEETLVKGRALAAALEPSGAAGWPSDDLAGDGSSGPGLAALTGL